MAIEYKFTRVEPLMDVSNKVAKWVVGLTATDAVLSKTAYIDAEVNAQEPFKTREEWTIDEIRTFCESVSVDNNWESILSDNINAQSFIRGDNVNLD